MLYFFMVAHKATCQTLSKAFFEVSEDMVEVLLVLVLEIFLTENAYFEDLLCDAPICSEASLFFSDDLLRLWLQSVQYDLQYDFAWVADEADRSVVLALLQVAFLGKCDDQELGPRGWPFSCRPNLDADCRDSSDYFFSNCLDQFRWDVVHSN